MKRGSIGRFLLLSGVGATALTLAAPAFADEFDSLLEQLNSATAELKKFEDDAPKKIDETLALKAKHEAQYSALDQESSRVDAEGSSIDSERPGVQSLCTGTYPEDQLAAAKARCDAVMGPFNSRVQTYNSHLDTLKQKYADIDRSEDERVRAAQALQQQYESLKGRVTSLKNALAAAARARCAANAARESEEEMAHAQSVCFDNASTQIAKAFGQTPPKPSSSAAPNSARTPEQAIKEYRDSGPAQPGTGMRKTSPPPPPPPPPGN